MSSNGLKSKIANFLVGLADLISKDNPKKQLTQECVQKELDEFVKKNGINAENFDSKQFQVDFMQYLKDKNYDCEGMSALASATNSEEEKEDVAEVKKMPATIQKISEDLNDCINGLEIFSRTISMAPGLVCYTIEKIAPNDKKPYVTYRPTSRVISQVHENGANGGTIFLSYSHKIIKPADFNGQKTARVISEDEALYTPLTKEHALYVCKILNAQSRIFYTQQMKKYQKTK